MCLFTVFASVLSTGCGIMYAYHIIDIGSLSIGIGVSVSILVLGFINQITPFHSRMNVVSPQNTAEMSVQPGIQQKQCLISNVKSNESICIGKNNDAYIVVIQPSHEDSV